MLHKIYIYIYIYIYIIIIIKTRGYNRNYWDPEEADPTIGCMVLSVHHMWVEFVVGPLLCSERFLSGYSGFPLSSKTNLFQIPIRPGIRQTNNHYMDVPPANRYLFIYLH